MNVLIDCDVIALEPVVDLTRARSNLIERPRVVHPVVNVARRENLSSVQDFSCTDDRFSRLAEKSRPETERCVGENHFLRL
jgi:hypothetical protein